MEFSTWLFRVNTESITICARVKTQTMIRMTSKRYPNYLTFFWNLKFLCYLVSHQRNHTFHVDDGLFSCSFQSYSEKGKIQSFHSIDKSHRLLCYDTNSKIWCQLHSYCGKFSLANNIKIGMNTFFCLASEHCCCA